MAYIQPHPSKLFLLQNERLSALESEVQDLRELVDKLAKLSNVELPEKIQEPEPIQVPLIKQVKTSSSNNKKDKVLTNSQP